jgi:hypothetical protein
MTVDVKVQKAVREFIISSSGSDLIVPGSQSLLWQLVKQHLKVVPENYRTIADRSEYIRIELLTVNSSKVFTRKMKGFGKGTFRDVTLNTAYRSWLDPAGQNAVAGHLRRSFKECFHNFVMGAIFDNPELQQKKAIENFCELYGITFDEINYEMLVKSWLRSPQRKKINGQGNICPLAF